MGGVEGERTLEEAAGCRGAGVVMDLRVGQTRVIVDDRVHIVDAVGEMILRAPITRDSVPRTLEAHVLAHVHV